MFHYRWGDWLREDPQLRAQMLAHELHRVKREAYYRDRVHAQAKPGAAGTRPSADPLAAIKSRWGLKY